MTLLRLSAVSVFAVACGPAAPASAPPRTKAAAGELRSPRDFEAITDRDERAREIFLEASRVLLHPRCVNCHPAGDVPAQGDPGRPHDPPVERGPSDSGVVGMECSGCHQDRNAELARVPGAPHWQLAPKAMAWVGKTPAALCEQLKDPARNGNRQLAQIVDHVSHDALVGWGWAPGHGRTPAPGSQAAFGALVAAWVEAGAACPKPELSPKARRHPEGAKRQEAAR